MVPPDPAHAPMIDLAVEILGGALVGLSLGLIGAGGAILSMPIFTLVLGHPLGVAVLEALAVTAAIATFSGARAALARQIDGARLLAFLLPGLAGAWLGGPIGAWLDDKVQAYLFAALALVAAWRMVVTSAAAEAAEDDAARPSAKALAAAGAIGLSVGVLTAVIGVGGGFLLIPALVLVARLPMKRAVGTSLVLIAANSAVAFASNAHHGRENFAAIEWKPVAIVAACGIAGSVAGSALSARLPAKALKRVFAVILVLVAASIAIRAA